jgi:hypothetical protein
VAVFGNSVSDDPKDRPFVRMLRQKYFGCHVRVMSSALFGVLHLGTHIIFLLFPMALLACWLILLNDVGMSSFVSVF